MDDNRFLLSTSMPTPGQAKLAWGTIAVLCIAGLLVTPFARIHLPGTEGLLPAYGAAVFLAEAITAGLLFSLYYVMPRTAVLILAAGYLVSALSIVPWMLSFPGVFQAFGLDSGPQGTAAIAALRRLLFPMAVVAYALLKNRPVGPVGLRGMRRRIATCVVAVLLWTLTVAFYVLGTAGWLPPFLSAGGTLTIVWMLVPAIALLLYAAGIALLVRGVRSVVDTWLIVVLVALTIETVLLAYVSAGLRLSLGWWAGRVYGLASASLVLMVLLSEAVLMQGRLARSMAAEQRARSDRLTAMEALSAMVAHEVNQPLASMVTNASAGLRWLDRPQPDLAEAGDAFRRIVADGHAAGEVVAGVRTMFRRGARDCEPLDLNAIVADALRRAADETRLAGIAVTTCLHAPLPRVLGNPAQIQRLVANLVSNAVDAMLAGPSDPRRLLVATSGQEDRVTLSVADTGIGIEPATGHAIFEPFVTTKLDGMGMGLMFCRVVAEAHGGRVTHAPNHPQGTIFTIALPAATVSRDASSDDRAGP
ncbi:sensor histidine kinase [Aurantimonas manganoxydans]|uniref:sensor histidine kinase n=1 Tax=Aurantimonas manganoxydans TaxID=651183 RepID=UPI0003140547|nr:ATP-binding protein [Aurantimonas manganoxydans]